jgi:hypothetical protein
MDFWDFVRPNRKKVLGTIIVYFSILISGFVSGSLGQIFFADAIESISGFINQTALKESLFSTNVLTSVILLFLLNFIIELIFIYLAICLILTMAKKK